MRDAVITNLLLLAILLTLWFVAASDSVGF